VVRIRLTLLKNCMLAFALGLLILSTLQTLSRQKLQRRTKRSHSLSVEEQILIALHFYASGTFYQVVGDNIGVDKSTVSDVVKAVSIALASLVSQPSISQTKHKFFLLGNMPNTIGVIDCTHVHIQAPHEKEWEYINRKGRRSINIQLVGDADLIITNCVSALYRELQTNRPDAIILGDSAYPLLPWLMTPFFAATTPAQARFNTAHCKTRCAIERLNGVLKRRFTCLNYLRVEPQGACNIILACIALHNIATRRNVPLCDDVCDVPGPAEEPDQPLNIKESLQLLSDMNQTEEMLS
uniref:Putative nuclease HARBI1 n=1 Tax=Acanthochromis polyacanthus TaxID=80966 RepID=A0A3Q1ESG2_9TELE